MRDKGCRSEVPKKLKNELKKLESSWSSDGGNRRGKGINLL